MVFPSLVAMASYSACVMARMVLTGVVSEGFLAIALAPCAAVA